MLEILKNEKISILLAVLVAIICCVSFYIDLVMIDDRNWFQRSGALVVLAGVEMQYSKIASLWKTEQVLPQLCNSDIDPATPWAIRKVDGMDPVAKNAREIAIHTHGIITRKSLKDTIAIIFIISGTCIWAYGDLPFVDQCSTYR